MNERNGYVKVWFIPDVTITSTDPPFIEGLRDSMWVKYKDGVCPKTKKEWEKLIGLPIREILS